MELKGRALYNLLQISWQENRALQVKPWQVEDWRKLTTKELFHRLRALEIDLDEERFGVFSEDSNSPEELLECLCLEEDSEEKHERVYLLIFELWRRLCRDKQSLSIFCDELDQLIEFYDRDALGDEEVVQKALSNLEDILDDNSDVEGSPQEVFAEIAKYCAHDLETFIYDYISDKLKEDTATYASELIDAFYQYVSNKTYFDFLRARLFVSSDTPEADILYQRLLSQLEEEPDLELLLQIVESLIHRGDITLFRAAVKQSLPHLSTEQEFQDLLEMAAEYYRCLDREHEEKAVLTLMQKRSHLSLQQKLDLADNALTHFSKLLI